MLHHAAAIEEVGRQGLDAGFQDMDQHRQVQLPGQLPGFFEKAVGATLGS